MDDFTGCSFIPASIWAKNQHLMFNIDWELSFSVGPLGTNPLKTPVAATFVNFLWPSTPSHANIMILAVAATHAGPNLFLGHLHIKFKISMEPWGWRAYRVWHFWQSLGSKSAFATDRWQINFGRSKQVIIARKLGSHTPKACFNIFLHFPGNNWQCACSPGV